MNFCIVFIYLFILVQRKFDYDFRTWRVVIGGLRLKIIRHGGAEEVDEGILI